jgi:hypothetical protein
LKPSPCGQTIRFFTESPVPELSNCRHYISLGGMHYGRKPDILGHRQHEPGQPLGKAATLTNTEPKFRKMELLALASNFRVMARQVDRFSNWCFRPRPGRWVHGLPGQRVLPSPVGVVPVWWR